MHQKAPSLPPLVGYAELEATYGWNKRTLQRWVRAGKLPRPTTTPGGRVAWLLADMEAFIEQMHKGLALAAATDPLKLAPEKLGDAALDLLTRALEHEIGGPVDPAGIRVTYGPPSPTISEEQLATAEAQEAAIWQLRFADFGAARSFVMAAWLFPELRPIFADGAENDAVRDLFLDEDQFRTVALSAMNYYSWEHGLASLKAMSTTARN